MKKDKKRTFKGTVGRNAARQTQGTQSAHLRLPKGISLFKEEPKSRVDLDILPYVVTSNVHPDRDDEYGIALPKALWYKRPYWLHRGLGPNNDALVCPSTIKQKCPICEYRAQLLKEGAEWNDDSVKSLRPSLRNLYVVIPKGSKTYEEKIHIWDISQFLFQAKLNEEVQENEQYETFPDLEEGFTLRIRFSEEAFANNKYASTSRIDFVERKPYSESILDKVPDLDELLVIKPYKIISAQFFGNLEAAETVEDEEEVEVPFDEEPATTAGKIVPNKDEDEDEDDEDQDDEGDEDEEEEVRKPSPPAKKQPAPPKSAPPKSPGKGKTANPAPAPKPAKPAKAAKEKCPHGHEFGTDVDEHDECEDCDKWDACMDAQ